MKKEIHPKEYREVVFRDASQNFMFLTRSTVVTQETVKFEGKEYPVIDVQISSASHPFYTGEEKIIDTEGRVDRFAARRKKAEELKNALGNKAKKAANSQEKKSKKSTESEKIEKAEG